MSLEAVIPPPSNREPILFSYMIRIVSFVAVVLFHFNMAIVQFHPNSMLLGKLSYAGQTVGDMAISLFIITSGFSLEMSTRGKFEVKKYLSKRIISIYPSFWVCYLLVGLLLFISTGHLNGDGNHSKFILSIIGLDGFFLYKMQNYYLVGEWYTGYMLLTYLLFPLLLIGIRFNPAITVVVVTIIFSILYINYDKIFQVYINCNPLMRLPDFLFGIIFSKYIYKNIKLFYLSGVVGFCILIVLTNFMTNLPSQIYMLIFGCCLYSTLAVLFNTLKSSIKLTIICKSLANLTFIAFLLHHQIIYYLFGKLHYDEMTKIEAYYFFATICFLSISSAYFISPIITKFETSLKKLLLG
jgi:peptidoglycan/LPS O-acetylase OafA/YrhL